MIVLVILAYLFIGLVLVVLAEETNSETGIIEVLLAWPLILFVASAVFVASLIYDWIKNKK